MTLAKCPRCGVLVGPYYTDSLMEYIGLGYVDSVRKCLEGKCPGLYLCTGSGCLGVLRCPTWGLMRGNGSALTAACYVKHCKQTKLQMVKLLIDAKADVNMRVPSGEHSDYRSSERETPLLAAVFARPLGQGDVGRKEHVESCAECIVLLLEARADPELQNSRGKRAIDFAQSLPKRYDPIRLAFGMPPQERYKCTECNEVKSREAFKTQASRHRMKRCLVCSFPVCVQCGKQRELVAALRSEKEADGSYMCEECKYPVCSHCKITPRPRKSKRYSVQSMPVWFCSKVRCRKHASKRL